MHAAMLCVCLTTVDLHHEFAGLPPYEYAYRCWMGGCEYVCELERVLPLYRATPRFEEMDAAHKEARALTYLWSEAADAQNPAASTFSRRFHAREAQRFWRWELGHPPALPFWRLPWH